MSKMPPSCTPKSPAADLCAADADDQPQHCRYCYSPSLVLDWAQGDRVCTACGIVDEEHVRDEGPEWREYANDDDAGARGGPSTAARAGLIPTDESKYLGGLQPTTLSKHPYGGAYGAGVNREVVAAESRVRRTLLSTNRRLDHMMEAAHKAQMEEARLARRVMARRRRDAKRAAAAELGRGHDVAYVTDHPFALDEDLSAIGREHLDLVQQEEDARHLEGATVQTEKWSLDRAVLLHGTHDEQRHDSTFHPIFGQQQPARDIEQEREALSKKLDSAQRTAAADLYRASRILLDAARALELPDRVVEEATTMLCKYAAAKDGFKVRGVTIRSKEKTTGEELARHRNLNKGRQMAALSSAFVYLSAKKFGQGRPLKDVCNSFRFDPVDGKQESVTHDAYIKPKHCSRAMTEVKILFPEYVKSVASPTSASEKGAAATVSTNNTNSALPDENAAASSTAADMAAGLGIVFSHRNEAEINTCVENAGRKLNLPPPAITAIRRLSVFVLKEQIQLGLGSSTKPQTLCAAMTHLTCLAGSSMKKLAGQAVGQSLAPTTEVSQPKRKHVRARGKTRPTKRHRVKAEGTESTVSAMMLPTNANTSVEKQQRGAEKSHNDTGAFDVMSHAAVDMQDEILSKSEQETLQVWDVWYSQKSWTRDIGAIAESYSASQAATTDFYKKRVHYRRKQLLELLQADNISESRETTLLLTRIAAAATLMASRV